MMASVCHVHASITTTTKCKQYMLHTYIKVQCLPIMLTLKCTPCLSCLAYMCTPACDVSKWAHAGANLDVDVPWKYLNFFLDDDMRLREIGREYGAGRMLTGEVKKELIGVRPVWPDDPHLNLQSAGKRALCIDWMSPASASARSGWGATRQQVPAGPPLPR